MKTYGEWIFYLLLVALTFAPIHRPAWLVACGYILAIGVLSAIIRHIWKEWRASTPTPEQRERLNRELLGYETPTDSLSKEPRP